MKKNNWLYHILIDFKFSFLLVLIITGVNAVASLLYPQYITKVIDVAIPYKDTRYLLENVALLAMTGIISVVCYLVISFIFYHVSNEMVIHIKKFLLNCVFQLNGQQIQEKSGQLVTCMIQDINNLEALATQLITTTLTDIITLVVTVVVLAGIDKTIIILAVVVYPFLILAQIGFNKMIGKTSRELMGEIDQSNSLLKELSNMLYEYIAINGRQYFVKRFIGVEKDVRLQRMKLNMLVSYNRLLPEFVNTGIFIMVLALGALEAIDQQITIGELTILVMYIERLFYPLMRLMLVAGEAQKASISTKRITTFMK